MEKVEVERIENDDDYNDDDDDDDVNYKLVERITKDLSVSHYKLLNELINHRLQRNVNCHPQYVNDTFAAFTLHKTHITLDLSYIASYYKIGQLITKSKLSNNQKNKLLIEPVITKIFPNVTEITVNTTKLPESCRYIYPFDILDILSLFSEKSSIKKITIKAQRKDRMSWSHSTSWSDNSVKQTSNSWLIEATSQTTLQNQLLVKWLISKLIHVPFILHDSVYWEDWLQILRELEY
eukprot:145942_1